MWKLVSEDVVWRKLDNGVQESRVVSSFTPDDPDYEEVMALVAAGQIVQAE